jgi:hypothetical protein
MKDDIERLTELVKKATEDITNCNFDIEGISPEYISLADSIIECLGNVKEIYDFESELADGNLSASVPGRHNYYAGPIKDLYYKLKHLTWQAEEVAKGDYSQRVDFLGSFSDSFNYMITELDKREKKVREQAEEKVQMAESQNAHLRKEMDIQMVHYQAYRDYVKSFIEFRKHYKNMMGEVFELFQNGKYEDGRLLIADINDRMASEVIISRNYSNNECVDAVMIEIANACKKRGIEFSGMVFVPVNFAFEKEEMLVRIIDYSELIYSLLDIPGHQKRRISIVSSQKKNWMSVAVRYYAETGEFPENFEDCVSEESKKIISRIKEAADQCGNFLNITYIPETHKIGITLHVCTDM